MTFFKIILFWLLVLLCIFLAYLHIGLQSHEDGVVNMAPAIYMSIFMILMYMIGKGIFPTISLFILIILLFVIHYVGFVFVMDEFSSFTDFGYSLHFNVRNILSCVIPVVALVYIKKITATNMIFYLLLIFGAMQVFILVNEVPEIIKDLKRKKIKPILFPIVPVIYHLILIIVFSF